MQGRAQPRVERVHIAVYAADHGVAAEGVSAFPQAVTGEMVRNFATGGAAISVLARELGATLEVINLGTVNDPGPVPGVMDQRLGSSTVNFTEEAAMSERQLALALNVGRQVLERAKKAGAELYIGGDMGIANTTAATALACALLNLAPGRLAGPGTGLDSKGVAHKAAVIERARPASGAHGHAARGAAARGGIRNRRARRQLYRVRTDGHTGPGGRPYHFGRSACGKGHPPSSRGMVPVLACVGRAGPSGYAFGVGGAAGA